jgi:hypothetical protein
MISIDRNRLLPSFLISAAQMNWPLGKAPASPASLVPPKDFVVHASPAALGGAALDCLVQCANGELLAVDYDIICRMAPAVRRKFGR